MKDEDKTREQLISELAELRQQGTEQKGIDEDIRKSRDLAEEIVNTVREPMLVLDADLHVKSANTSFHRVNQRAILTQF